MEKGRNQSNVRTPTRAWGIKNASGMLGFSGDPPETMDLPSNQDPRHLLIAAKYPQDKSAYVTNRGNYLSTTLPIWVNSHHSVDPGEYEVELIFTASGGVSGRVLLTVANDGRNGTVRLELVPRHTVKR